MSEASPAAIAVRPATTADADSIWNILEPVIRKGETYAIDPDLSRKEALAYWCGADRETFLATDAEGAALGTYYLKANQMGGGSHVANCGYVTGEAARGRGVARAMACHSFDQARQRGFRAMQFNFVVSTNKGAVRLWQNLGFQTVGRVPEAFAHPEHGFVDTLVMHRML